MALLESESLPIGSSMPEFELTDVFGEKQSSDQMNGYDAILIMFICAHCPYVIAVEDRILDLVEFYEYEDVKFIAICSNDPTDYPEDSPENLKKRAESKGYKFPYLIDESQTVAKSFGAVCTPEFFLYNKNKELVYHGRLDDNWKEPQNVQKEELKIAISATLRGSKTAIIQYPSMGCSIKWKS